MRDDKKMRYIKPEISGKINDIVDQFFAEKGAKTPEELLETITDLLPIEKMNFDTVRSRLEGYIVATDKFWELAMASKKASRAEIVKLAGLRPLSHYHYLTGSREPANEMLTRDDMLTDPSTAIVKLRDDIVGLAKVLPDILAEPAAAE